MTKTFGKMTKGQLRALTVILKTNTARSSEERLPAIDKEKYGTEPQLTDVVSRVCGVIHVFCFILWVAPKMRSELCEQFDILLVCPSNKFNL